jgi:fatty-acyl-CoA synthase
VAANAISRPGATAIIDELGTLTFRQVHGRTNALAHSLREAGVAEGRGVAILCRNHRGFVEATVACAKLGADLVYLNTSFAGPEIAAAIEQQGVSALIYDPEFGALVGAADHRCRRFVAWGSSAAEGADPSLEELIEAGDATDLAPPADKGSVVVLTSGTTGAPKGAQRAQPDSARSFASLLSMIPLRAGEPTMVAAPMFHAWGFLHLMLGVDLGSTLVLRRKFKPDQTLSAIAQHDCTALVVVPVMLSRVLALGSEAIGAHDLRALRVIASSGSALRPELALEVMDRFGDVLYNLYGSTEAGWVSIATPADLRAAPGTAGRIPPAMMVKLLDKAGREVPAGRTGRILVSSELVFEGYTGARGKPTPGGLFATGDVGHIDADGRLFVDGRDDEMIVSGGENVFPQEVEDLLSDNPAVADVAVIGVDDEQFGQALKAFVVRQPGSPIGESDLKDYVKSNLARFKVPRQIEFVDKLPRNAAGKVLKRALAERD